MSTLREAAQQALVAWQVATYGHPSHHKATLLAMTALRAALAQQEQEPTVRFKCTVVDDQHPNGVPFEQWVNAPQQEAPKGGGNLPPPLQAEPVEEPVAYTGDVARRMREAEMTFHLGMPHAVVMQQMTRFHDLVCAEASIKSAAAFAAPPRREWQGLRNKEIVQIVTDNLTGGDWVDVARAIEDALKEKNND
jgi:hypothetical protein